MPITSSIVGARRRTLGVRGTGMVPVGNLSTTYPAGTTANLINNAGGGYYALRHIACADVASLRLVYGNFFDQGTAVPIEQSTLNLITVRAYIMVASPGLRVPQVYRYISASANWNAAGAYVVGDMVRVTGGTNWVCIQANTNQSPVAGSAYWELVNYWPVHFPGESATRDVTIQPLGLVVSDSVPLSQLLLKGESFYSITLVQPNNGTANTGNYPWGSTCDPAVDWCAPSAIGAAPLDYTTSPPASQVSLPVGGKTYGPMSVIGAPSSSGGAVVYLLGDSICAGSVDVNIMVNEAGGWALRMLTDNPTTPTRYLYQHFRSAKGSSKGSFQVGPGTMLRYTMLAGCTHIVDQYGVNDMGVTASTLAVMQANALARWATYKAMGLKVIACTITPITTSTDAWVTVVNQTPITNFGAASKWSQYNEWVRTKPAPLDGIIDVAAAVLDPAGGVVWKANYTPDGIHPNQAAHTAIALAAPVVALFGQPV